MKKGWLRLGIIVLAVTVLLPVLIFILLQTPPGERFVLQQARHYLRNHSDIDLKVSGIHINFLNGTVILDDAVVQAFSVPDLPPLFKADRIQVQLSISDAFHKHWIIEKLDLSAPQIQYYIDARGRTNLPRPETSGGKSPELVILQGEAANGSFRLLDLRKELLLQLSGWQLAAEGSRLTQAHHIRFTSGPNSTFEYRGRALPIHSIVFEGTLQKSSIQIDSAQITAADSNLSLKGTIRDFSNPDLDLQLNPKLGLDRILRVADLKEKIQGNLSGTATVSGRLDHLHVESRLTASNFSALNYHQTGFDIKVRLEWNRESSKLAVHDFDLSSPEGSVSGKAEIFHGAKPGMNTLEARIQDLDLSPLWKETKSGFDLAGRGTGAVALQWKGPLNPSQLAGEAHLKLAASRSVPDRDVLPISGELDARLRPGNITGALRSFGLLGAEVSGHFSLRSFKEIEGTFDGVSTNIHIPALQVTQFLGKPESALARLPVQGHARFNAEVSGKLSRPKIIASLDTASLQAYEFKHLRVKADATIEDSRMAFRGRVVLPEDSSILAEGNLDFGGQETTLNLNARADPLSMDSIRSVLDSNIPASGNLKVSLSLNGPVDKLGGHASITGDELSIYQEPAGHLDLELSLAGGNLRSTRFKLLKDPENPKADFLDAQFVYNLDSGRYEFQATGKDLKFERPALMRGMPVQGSIQMVASGSGTVEHPSADLRLESNDLQVRQKPLGPVAISAALRDEQLTIEASVPALSISAKAGIATRDPYLFEGALHASDSDLSRLELKGASGQLLTGILDADLQGSGSLKNISQSQLSAQIRNLQMQSGKLEVHIRNPFRMDFRDNSVELLSPAVIVSGNSQLEITGRVPVHQPAPEGTLRFKGQLDLAQASGFFPIPGGVAPAGILNLDFALAGTTQNVSSAGTISLDRGTVQLPADSVPLSEVTIRVTVQDGSLILKQANAAWGEGKISLTGEFPFGLLPRNLPLQFPRKEGPADFSLALTDLRPELSRALPKGMTGLVSLTANGQFTALNLRALTAQIQFPEMSLRYNNIDFRQKQPSVITIRDGIASVSRFSISGVDTNLDMGGFVGFLHGSPLDLSLVGNIDAALLTSLSKDLKLAGNMQVKMNAAGTLDAPVLSGLASMSGGKLRLRSPRIVADSLSVLLSFSPNQISVRQFKGTLNGGTVDLKGTIGYRNRTLNDFNLNADLQDVFLNFPEGLKSVSGGNLTITSSDNAIVVGGNMRVRESSYREPLGVSSELMSYLKSQQVIEVGEEPSALLERIRLNLGVRTTSPVLVQNNIAKLEATANLRIVGSFYEPSMTGRVTLNEGGEIVINQRTYYITRGSIILANETRIEPDLNISAQTKVDTYTITLQLTGPLERLSTTLTSEPALAEADILSLLLTGKTASESQTPGVIRTQALSLLAGEAGEELTRSARQALHLSTFRIDPGLISSESDPGARLTLGEDIAKNLSLVYSMNLTNGGDQIWAAQYNITRRFSTQATKQQDNTYRFEFRHDLRFGGTTTNRTSRRKEVPEFRIGSIQFQGESPFSEQTMLDKFNVKSGDKFEFPKVQKGLDRLHEYFASENRLEADIRMQRETGQKTIDLKLNINPGPTVTFSYEGFPVSEDVKKTVESAWINGVFETERSDDAVLAIRRSLIEAGYLQAEVTCQVAVENNQKQVRFLIKPGTRYPKIPITFPGASEISAGALNDALDAANLNLEVYIDPEKVADFLTRYYRDRGYLQARVDLPQLKLDPESGRGKVSIQVREGPLFTIGDLEFVGNTAFNYDQIWSVIPTSSGSSYNPDTLRDAVKAIENLYHSKGYNDVSVTFRVVQDTQAAHANLTFLITERKQSVIRDIAIEGYQGTSREFVERQLDFKNGDVLDYARINETRRRLYATGVYTSVDIQSEDMKDTAPDSPVKNIRIQVRLREVRPYRMQYGLFYDTDRSIGGLLEAQNLNFLGKASNLGLSLRYDSNLKEGRLYFNQPFITKIHVKMDATIFAQRETREAFSANRIGFSLTRQKQLPRKYLFDYGYRYDHVRWDGLPPDPTIFQASTPVARLIATLSRDTRDSILDPTRGEFSSHSLEFGPTWLGSEYGFARYYGQYFRYVPLDKFLGWPGKDREGNPIPPRLIYAGALRLGLTSAFAGQSVISPERFFAGGGTTMRGFQQDMLGPLETIEVPTTTPGQPPTFVTRPVGGEALFLFNNEIRFPIFGMLQGVGFLDLGNVYPRISDIHFDIRKSAGAGLRIKIKYVPLRFDYGFKLDRRPGESGSAFFFSIGQAF